MTIKNFMPGEHQVTWNGKTSDGYNAVSGVYFYGINAGKQMVIRRMTLIR